MDEFSETLKFFFQVVVKRQTYLNILYLLLSFPLGSAYFFFLVTGISIALLAAPLIYHFVPLQIWFT
jgi:hypothetical protein